MAFDAFIRIDGIEGESSDREYRGWIEIMDFGLGVQQRPLPIPSSAGGIAVDRADFSDFMIRKPVDVASPLLALSCAAGTHIDEVVVALCRAGSEKAKFMEYHITNCIISRFRVYGADQYGFAFPVESVGIHFASIRWCYIQQSRKGGYAAGNIAAGWDLQRNCKM